MDTNVIIAAIRSLRGASAHLLAAIELGKVEMLVSVPLMMEYEQVCKRSEHRAGLLKTESAVDAFLDGLAARATPVIVRYNWRPQLNDAGDEMVLETAINGVADAIITFNTRHFGAAAHFGIELAQPGDLLRRISS
ncbi:MAG: putative toxin-antitoxin system toxin component, PIN family [Holosporales bacterium]